MGWFRFYDQVVDDPKVQRLPDRHFRAWVNLLCVAARNDGRITNDFGDLAFILRLTEAQTRETVQALIASGLIEKQENAYIPHSWHKRQYKSDLSTERVKQFRKRFMKRNETVSETPPDTDSDSDTEKENPKTDSLKRDMEQAFEVWYRSYPKHVGRGQAKRAFRTALSKTTLDRLNEGVEALKRQAGDARFIPNPATWLNGERWLDEIVDPQEQIQALLRRSLANGTEPRAGSKPEMDDGALAGAGRDHA